ncbi:MAG: hypothetical protein EAZ53_15340 [Bacteroidetes bacterium]|nr:MAG: hypothetical protein EAZ53_15340 [Bacteroidota bacterium]
MNTPGLPTSTPSMQEISPTFTPFDLQAKGYNVESFTIDLDKLGVEGRSIYKISCFAIFSSLQFMPLHFHHLSF